MAKGRPKGSKNKPKEQNTEDNLKCSCEDNKEVEE
jgi:hypothetical protein